MKKFVLLTLLCSGILLSTAQVQVTTTTYDLEAAGLHRGWRIMNGGTENGKPFVNFGQASCNVDKDASFAGTTYTYNGLKWKFQKVQFSESLQYVNTEKKEFGSTKEALTYLPVFGKTFNPTPTASVASTIFKGAGGLGGKLCTTDYLGQLVVAPDITMTGFKVAVTRIFTDVIPIVDKRTNQPTEFCAEMPVFGLVKSESPKEEKGQKWIVQFNDAVINGGNILFVTSGVYPDNTKAHYVFRKYNTALQVEKELVFTTDYYAHVNGHTLVQPDGSSDYVFVLQVIDYSDKSNKIGTKDGQLMEYLRVDGNTFAIEERFEFKAPSTGWIAEKAIEKAGAVYVMGPASGGTTKATYTDQLYRSSKSKLSYQIAKFKGGKAEYITSNSADEMTAKSQLVPGTKGKAATTAIMAITNSTIDYQLVNGKMFISGQQASTDKYGTPTYENMAVWVFDEQGKIAASYLKPETNFSKANLLFSKDGNTTYWAIYDYASQNKMMGVYPIPDKFKFVAPMLQVAKINNATNKVDSFETVGTEEYALEYQNEFLFDSDTHIGFIGKSLAKKAKDTDLVLITVKK